MQYSLQKDYTDLFMTKEINSNSLFSKELFPEYYIGLFQFAAFLTKLKINTSIFTFLNTSILIVDCFSFEEKYLTSICVYFYDDYIELFLKNKTYSFYKENYNFEFNIKQSFIKPDDYNQFYFKQLNLLLTEIKSFFTSLHY